MENEITKQIDIDFYDDGSIELNEGRITGVDRTTVNSFINKSSDRINSI